MLMSMRGPCSSCKDRRLPMIRRQPNHELTLTVESIPVDEPAFDVGTSAVQHALCDGVERKLKWEPSAR
eukprot:2484213-Pleurochrysis_carterae.AAC.1